MSSATVVTPEVMRSAKQAIESAIEHAVAIANSYLNTHESVAQAAWDGSARGASVATATQVTQDLTQIMNGGSRLAHGLAQAAALMEQQELDSAHRLTSFAVPAAGV